MGNRDPFREGWDRGTGLAWLWGGPPTTLIFIGLLLSRPFSFWILICVLIALTGTVLALVGYKRGYW